MLTGHIVHVRKVVLGLVGGILFSLCFGAGETFVANAQTVETSPEKGKYYSVTIERLSDGKAFEKACINGPPVPPLGFEVERQAVSLPVPDRAAGTSVLTVPAFNWVFGCSAVSGAMIAGFYDRSGYADMYTGPTNGGVMPLDNSSWPSWSDGSSTYQSCPLVASKSGVDGRVSEGSIDDYWIQYGSTASDPYITGGWTQHTWGDAIGDYMMTSQSAFSNSDGSTTFYNWSGSASPLTCDVMASYALPDGTLGRKHFYEARGYTVTDCYNQKTDNTIAGGFSFAQFKSEIDAGRPVMLNLEGHTVVGVGYDDTSNLVYIHDTWDYGNHTMTWGGSYSGMTLLSVSIVNLTGNLPPSVVNNYPDDNQIDVSTFTGVTVSFSKVIDQSTLTGSTLYLNKGSGTVPGSISYNSSTRTATFTPGVQLAMSTVYTATVTTGVKDLNGTPLTAGKSWSFTTGNTLMSERFDSTTLPAGWSVVDNTGTGAVWRFDDPGGRTNLTGGSGGFAIADSDNAGRISMDSELRSPVLNLAGYVGASLTFYNDFKFYSDEFADVDISINGGASWTNIWRKTGSYLGPSTETVDISPYTGNSNVMVRFHYYNANWEWWWQVDNVTVHATASPRTLSVTVSGSGSVNSNPSGIACTSGTCTHQFDPMASVTLMPTESVYSEFSGWSGGCSSYDGDNCVVVMDDNKAVTAIFTAIQPVYIPGTGYYASLQSAYADAPASSVIRAKAVELTGNVVAGLVKNVTLQGGYDGTFTTNDGFTTVTGNLVVESGSLTVQNLIIN